MRVVVVCLIVALAQSAVADVTPEARAQAAQLAADAMQRIKDRNDYAGASDNFQKAYDLTGELSYLLNVAIARRKANLPHQAVLAYKRYLADGGDKIAAELKAQVLADIDSVTRDSVAVTVTTHGAPAEVFLDGVAVGTASAAAPLLVLVNSDAGRAHVLRATRSGYLDVEQPLPKALPGERTAIELEPRANIGRITIDSEPPAAELSEGVAVRRPLGRAPQVIDLAPGDYELFARLPRYQVGRERVHVVGGEPQRVTIRLTPIETSWWERHHTKLYIGGAALIVAVASVFVVREIVKPDYGGTVIVYP